MNEQEMQELRERQRKDAEKRFREIYPAQDPRDVNPTIQEPPKKSKTKK